VRVARECVRHLLKNGTPAELVTVLGLTFKKNVVDIRDSRVVDIVRELQSFGVKVQVQDPLADPAAARREYGIIVENKSEPADAVVVAVAHEYYRQSGWPFITPLLRNGRGLVMDVKGVLDIPSKPADIQIWRL
jgi:UDP-N-acetyl-D-glucosamine/UDP-N-acetyl-D-galactosamine dehydrogenase